MRESHNRVRNSILAATLLVGLLSAHVLAEALADMRVSPGSVEWSPLEAYSSVVLTVSGGGYWAEKVFESGQRPFFEPFDEAGQLLPDGDYTWELRFLPEPLDINSDDYENARERAGVRHQGRHPAPAVESGNIRVFGGAIVNPDDAEEEPAAGLPPGERAPRPPADDGPGQTRDQVILDDLIVDGSACIGFDCINGEVFGFDTIRLKENNLRIKFDDTSTAASYPRNDWQLTANASANGGAEKFSIDDISGGRTPFTIEANAPTNSLYVDDGGRLGIRTSTPSVEIHVIDGDTPTLRLQQDGSSGFAPQTWDVAGNETNFFVRDVTNGSALSLRIRPGAPSSSIFVDVDGDVGLGTSSPDAVLDLERTSAGDKDVLRISNNGRGNFLFRNTASTGANDTWTVSHANNGVFAIDAGGGATELRIQQSGNLLIDGTLTANASTTADVFPDFVFEPEYPLMPLAELQAFVERERHLPNVMSSEDAEGGRAINMTRLQLQLLQKVEELTLYTLDQQRKIEALERRLAEREPQAESQ